MSTAKSNILQILKRKKSPLFLVIFVAGLSLLGWLFGKIIFASVSLKYIPIAPSTASIFIILSIIFLINNKTPKSHFNRSISISFILIVVLFCLIIFLDYLFSFKWDIENIFIKNPERLGNVLIGRMSPITSLLFVFICISILGISQFNIIKFKYISGSFSLLTCLVSSILIIGYLYKAPVLYGGLTIPVALPTAICFLLFSFTLLRVSEMQFWTFNLISKNPTGFQLLKSFLPIVVLVVILQGFLMTNFSIDQNNPTLTTAIILLIVVAITIYFVIRVSNTLGDELQKAEEEIRFQSEVMSNMSEAVYMIRFDDGIIVYVNPYFEKMFGYGYHEMLGKHVSIVNSPAEKNPLQTTNEIMEIINLNGSWRGEVENIRKDGTVFTCYASVTLFNHSTFGKLLVSIHTDITQRKQAEKEVKNKIEELISAYKQLEQFAFDNEELKQFAYISSHELQQPLRTISNYIQVFEEDYSGLMDDNALKYLYTIKDSTKRMNSLINALSGYSRLGLNKKLKNVDCKKLINEVIADLDAAIKTSDAIIKVSDMPVLNVYEIEIRQLFQNLILNAIKFQKTNIQPIIKISSAKINGKWKFSVSDNGIGIAPSHFERVFDMFQRLHINEKEYEGKGIGLAYCKKIVQLHLGEIWVESKIGEGSTFHFTIPNLII